MPATLTGRNKGSTESSAFHEASQLSKVIVIVTESSKSLDCDTIQHNSKEIKVSKLIIV